MPGTEAVTEEASNNKIEVLVAQAIRVKGKTILIAINVPSLGRYHCSIFGMKYTRWCVLSDVFLHTLYKFLLLQSFF